MVANAELYAALAAAQSEGQGVGKDAVNDFFINAKKPGSGGYATLAAYSHIARPILAKHGLAVVTMPSGEVREGAQPAVLNVKTGKDLNIETQTQLSTPCQLGMRSVLTHSSGGSLDMYFDVPLAKRDPQGLGSAITYARRYCLAAWLNMWAEDDDGETAVGRPPAKQAAPAAKKASAKELIELIVNAQTQTVLSHLKSEAEPYRGTPEWDSIVAVGKASQARLEQEAKDAALTAKK